MSSFANFNAALQIVDNAADMLEQLRLLVVDSRNERVMVGLTPASATGRQRREGARLTPAQAASKALYAADAAHLAAQVKARMLKPEAPPASDRTAAEKYEPRAGRAPRA